MDTDRVVVHLRAGGTSVLLDATGPGLPEVMHWGADLGEPDPAALAGAGDATAPAVARGVLDQAAPRSLLRQHAEGHSGRAGLAGHRSGTGWSPLLRLTGLERDTGADGTQRLTAQALDKAAGLALRLDLELAPAGVLRQRWTVRNDGAAPYQVDQLTAALPVPAQATELLDLTGHWARERHPQRRPYDIGSWVRESWRGRPGHDAATALVAGTAGFGFRSGEVWAVHVAWSGNQVAYAERGPSGGATLGGGELLAPGEVILDPVGEYVTPWVYFGYSGHGLDGLSAGFHRYLRSRPGHPGPDRPRPVVLNTWEARYFDHDLDRLRDLATAAARVGVERFVLDDGWFHGRRDDTAGLGDWYVDATVWPDGLDPLIAHVHALGMRFGLWVEPEMVNPDSDLYRAHPDWILRVDGRLPLTRRHQQVLDLANPDAYAYVHSRLTALLTDHDIDSVKWDHNRDLVDAGHAGRGGVHTQTLAVYRLLDELRRAHPNLEIESCASGGARVDLGILERTDRVWPSDCNDALERQTIQRWTGLLLPPELMGTHIGPPRAHTTGRTHDLSFRAATALFGHAGIEWDLGGAPAADLDALASWVDFHRRHRELLHGGDVVRADHPDPAALVHGVVSPDGNTALFAYVQLTTSRFAVPPPARLPGLAAERVYRVEPVYPAGEPVAVQWTPPGWLVSGRLVATGAVLGAVGITVPALAPEQALLLHLTAGR